ncbi:hypothetical protein E2C01_031782 [Portunus trituberculatus]|uniref:Uncharacterized protein n=1 Tax=Portunus trituberculatus TaxID=210409 RepID=A0A5B7EYR7_PORTR|nr:hypothetical protein [Portunus trituberculatus]
MRHGYFAVVAATRPHQTTPDLPPASQTASLSPSRPRDSRHIQHHGGLALPVTAAPPASPRTPDHHVRSSL